MTFPAEFSEARKRFHATLLKTTLTTNSAGIVSNADSSNTTSKAVASGIAKLLKSETVSERIAGQTSGNQFESICADFVSETFAKLGHLRPGTWDVHQVSGRNRLEIAKYEQYAHLVALDNAAKTNPDLAAALGSDYTITPDIVVARATETDEAICPNRLRQIQRKAASSSHPLRLLQCRPEQVSVLLQEDGKGVAVAELASLDALVVALAVFEVVKEIGGDGDGADHTEQFVHDEYLLQ